MGRYEWGANPAVDPLKDAAEPAGRKSSPTKIYRALSQHPGIGADKFVDTVYRRGRSSILS